MENKPIKYSQAQLLAIEIMATNPSISNTELSKKLNKTTAFAHIYLNECSLKNFSMSLSANSLDIFSKKNLSFLW